MKRNTALQPISRQHHLLLLAALLLEKGARRTAPLPVLQDFAKQTYQQLWQPYSAQMQQKLWPVLQQLKLDGNGLPQQHEQLEKLWQDSHQWTYHKEPEQLANAIRQWVRHQERQVFQHLQPQLSAAMLQQLSQWETTGEQCLHFTPAFWA